MKTVGHRIIPSLSPTPSAERLRAACRINEMTASFVPGAQIAAPKGVYRFRTLEEANRMEAKWLAEWMAQLTASRSK